MVVPSPVSHTQVAIVKKLTEMTADPTGRERLCCKVPIRQPPQVPCQSGKMAGPMRAVRDWDFPPKY